MLGFKGIDIKSNIICMNQYPLMHSNATQRKFLNNLYNVVKKKNSFENSLE